MFFININKDSNISLISQIYREIKIKILDGTLGKNSKLPSTRELALIFGVSNFQIFLMIISEY